MIVVVDVLTQQSPQSEEVGEYPPFVAEGANGGVERGAGGAVFATVCIGGAVSADHSQSIV